MEDGNARLQQTAKDTENLAKHCQKRCAKQAKKRQNGPTWPCVAKVMMKRSKRPQNTQRWHTPPFMTNFCDPGSPPPPGLTVGSGSLCLQQGQGQCLRCPIARATATSSLHQSVFVFCGHPDPPPQPTNFGVNCCTLALWVPFVHSDQTCYRNQFHHRHTPFVLGTWEETEGRFEISTAGLSMAILWNNSVASSHSW